MTHYNIENLETAYAIGLIKGITAPDIDQELAYSVLLEHIRQHPIYNAEVDYSETNYTVLSLLLDTEILECLYKNDWIILNDVVKHLVKTNNPYFDLEKLKTNMIAYNALSSWDSIRVETAEA